MPDILCLVAFFCGGCASPLLLWGTFSYEALKVRGLENAVLGCFYLKHCPAILRPNLWSLETLTNIWCYIVHTFVSWQNETFWFNFNAIYEIGTYFVYRFVLSTLVHSFFYYSQWLLCLWAAIHLVLKINAYFYHIVIHRFKVGLLQLLSFR